MILIGPEKDLCAAYVRVRAASSAFCGLIFMLYGLLFVCPFCDDVQLLHVSLAGFLVQFICNTRSAICEQVVCIFMCDL